MTRAMTADERYARAAARLARSRIAFRRMRYLMDIAMSSLICPPCNTSVSCSSVLG